MMIGGAGATAGEACSCFRCGYVSDTWVERCPKCRRSRMRTAKTVRRLGWAQLLLGVFLCGMMGVVTFNVAPMLLWPGAGEGGARFTGTSDQAVIILGLFGLVMLVGLGGVMNGVWQIVTGRRSRWLFLVVVALAALLWVAVWVARTSLKG